MIGESKILGKFNRFQPEFGDVPITFHVDMDGPSCRDVPLPLQPANR